VRLGYILIALLVLGSIYALTPLLKTATGDQSTPLIPKITNGVTEIVTANIGPIVPAIVSPGDTYTIELRPEYSSIAIPSAYIWTVKPVGDTLQVYNYTLTITQSGPGKYTIEIPGSVEEGLYDLVLAGDSIYSVPRSIWVVKTWPSILRFMEMTDLHFIAGQPDPFTGDINRFAAFTIGNLLAPQFILWLGDQADTASTNEYIMTLAYRYSYLYNIPILGVPGNHDYSTSGSPYAKYLGPTSWYRIIAGKLLIIGIWSPEQGYPSWEDLAFAGQVLQNYSGLPYKVILVHHPPFYYQGELYTWYNDTSVIKPYVPGGPSTPVSSYWSANMTALTYFLKLVEDYNVTMVLSGHTHRDFFVKYTSTRTGTTTLFMTFTTASQGSASYDGVSLMEFNLENGSLDFPLKPPTFMGFQNSSRALALNSIPIGIYPVPNSLGWSNLTFTYMNAIYGETGYTFRMENNNVSWINFSGRLVWSLPWNGNSVNFKVLYAENGASVRLVDYKIIGDRVFLLLESNLPYQGRLGFTIYTAEDTEAPVASLRMTVPKQPTVNRDVTIYVDVTDRGLGLDPLGLKIMLGNTPINYSPNPQSNTYTMTPQTYTEQFNTVTLAITVRVASNTTVTLPLLIQVFDNAGNKAVYEYDIAFQAPTPTTTTSPTTTTTTTTPVTTTTTPTTTTTSPTTATTTTSPTTTTITTTSATTSPTTTTTTTTPTTTTSPTTTTGGAQPGGSNTVILVIASVVIIILVLGVYVLKRR